MMIRAASLVLALTAVAAADPGSGSSRGSVRGTVLFEGEPPEQPVLARKAEKTCSQDRRDEAIVVTKGKLRDVLVRIKNGQIGVTGEHAAPAAPAVIDQQDCMYEPRVVGIVAGQKLVARNSDKVFHDVWGTLRGGKDLFNTPQRAGAPELTLDPSAAKPDDVVELKCGVHPWMHAYVVAQDSPFFAVTGADGAFSMAPGARHQVAADRDR
jgi:hypothetical protein